ncbi:hemerythrin [Kosmotoga pacifica]|uniref:Hemerythrin n=2 Tax=Kosmotoga pacifica TaxID=1330330 RepID=A0A0G2Z9P2_9BACT|nr:hemerythrin [Kosmotoga pacifica]
MLRELHSSPEKLEDIKEKFSVLIRELTPVDISKVEQELIQEGIPAESIQLMCNVHLDLFKKAIIEDEIQVEPWHPVHILVEEHRDMLNRLENFRKYVMEKVDDELPEELSKVLVYLDDMELYFQKEENGLFPYIEKHGVVQPPAIMWKEHDQLREWRKELKKLSENPNENLKQIKELVLSMAELLTDHIYKEHKVLFPTALKLISLEEWKEIRKAFDEVGYFSFKPSPFYQEEQEPEFADGLVNLGSGYMSPKQLKLMLDHLPVDITFVDETDTVRFFSENPDRIFGRTRAIIGRKVQNCHPPKSVDVVNKILRDFKEGKRNEADFWLKLGDKFIYIKYIAIRDSEGNYVGTLEVSQDIAPIQNITGEKRIYDDKNQEV